MATNRPPGPVGLLHHDPGHDLGHHASRPAHAPGIAGIHPLGTAVVHGPGKAATAGRALPSLGAGTVTLTIKGRSARVVHAERDPGISEGQVWKVSKDPFTGWLYDFGVKRSELRSAHKRYLDETARDLNQLRDRNWKLRIEGRASRTGSEGFNLSLSRDRAYSVHSYLKEKLTGVPMETDWVGEGLAAEAGEPDHKENMFYRAVLISVWPADKPRPPRPPPPSGATPSSKKSPTKEFKIHVIGGASGSLSTPFLKTASVGEDVLDLEILDVEERLICRYTYNGRSVGLGLGWSPAGPVSGVVYGGGSKWHSFQVPRHWTLDHIGGSAELHGIGVNTGALVSRSQTGFSFAYMEHWYSIVGTRVKISDIDTGDSIGTPSAGGSVSEGMLAPRGEPHHFDAE